MLNILGFSVAATGVGLACAFFYGGWEAMTIALMLSVMEVSLSFDNAIVNASILKDMDEKWRQRFLTWGIFIAVFGMRLLFPLLLVTFLTGLNPLEVVNLAIKDPESYEKHLSSVHGSISSFGGMFLLMVFLGFILDPKRDIYWLGKLEKSISKIGNLESMEVVFALIILLFVQSMATGQHQASILVAGLSGLIVYVIINSISKFMSHYYSEKVGTVVKRSGFISFIYLEILDASFSFDGVMGAFAITKDIIIIMIGLGIGAFFVRSLTILLVRRKTLQNYIYLEHGAHYAIGALALMMLLGVEYKIPEAFIGTVGLVLILLSFVSSLSSKKAS